MRRFLWITLLLILLIVGVGYLLGRGVFGVRQDGGEPTAGGIPPASVAARSSDRRGPDGKQILFGDLHAHTTFSFDAFLMSLPLFQGEGVHGPADACDFARYCSGLDFWSINDHAEGLTAHQWRETQRALRQCQDLAGDPRSPDLVSFLGWEWTQIGTTPETHYGHKNVVLRDLDEARVPTRPIASRRELITGQDGAPELGAAIRAGFIAAAPGGDDRQPYHDFALFMADRDDQVACPSGVPVRDLPEECSESAATPTELFAKLDEWELPYFVIPHGNTWGIYTPPGTTWDKQLRAHDDPDRHEFLFELFSGHGNSEQYRAWRGIERADDGSVRCPEPSESYLPSCWRAGELVRDRCETAGEDEAECEARAVAARQHYAEAGVMGHVTVPGAQATDWLDAGQCRDCFMPAYSYRPGGSGQYALAIGDFDRIQPDGRPQRFSFGFLGSSDNHTARPGTGYKEVNRREMTEAGEAGFGGFTSELSEPEPRSVPLDEAFIKVPEFERFASFLGTGGLAAVHSEGRDRESIWNALARKEVYATSGDRILLWFDAETPNGESTTMGSGVELAETPRFRVRAVGAFHQKPGCPDHSVSALGADRLHHLCRGECYNPSDDRKRIERIEVVRIRPAIDPAELAHEQIEDPWRVLECGGDPSGCEVEFDDPEYAASGRDALYYVRAIQEPSQAINADGVRCEYDDAGRCIKTTPCYGDPRTEYEDDCLGETQERAWSSPIYLHHPG